MGSHGGLRKVREGLFPYVRALLRLTLHSKFGYDQALVLPAPQTLCWIFQWVCLVPIWTSFSLYSLCFLAVAKKPLCNKGINFRGGGGKETTLFHIYPQGCQQKRHKRFNPAVPNLSLDPDKLQHALLLFCFNFGTKGNPWRHRFRSLFTCCSFPHSLMRSNITERTSGWKLLEKCFLKPAQFISVATPLQNIKIKLQLGKTSDEIVSGGKKNHGMELFLCYILFSCYI